MGTQMDTTGIVAVDNGAEGYPKIVHMALTSSELTYPYYLSIASVLKTQELDELILWSFGEPQGTYYRVISDRVTLKLVDRPSFPVLDGETPNCVKASLKDYLEWKALYEHGGLFLDLDTFCVKDAFSILDDKHEIAVGFSVHRLDEGYYPFDSGIVFAKRHSTLMKQMLDRSIAILNGSDFNYGDTGPGLLHSVVMGDGGKVQLVEFGVLGGFGSSGWPNKLYERDGELLEQSRILHLCSTATADRFHQITEQYIKTTDALYARTVRAVLTEQEWSPIGTSCSSLSNTSQKAVPSDSRPVNDQECVSDYTQVLYDEEYYKKIDLEEQNQACWLANILVDMYHPSSVVDFGCGAGTYLKPFLDRGIRCLGIDNESAAKSASSVGQHITICDMVDDLQIGQFDIAICLETLEHIAAPHADRALDNLTNASELVVFSAAPPGQGGVGHLNCQPPEYWRDAFARRGFAYDHDTTCRVIEHVADCRHMSWLDNNLMIFVKETSGTLVAEPHKRFHLLGLAHLPTNKTEALACAYSQKVLKMAKMLKSLGHTVIFYGVEGSDVECDEFVQVSTQSVLKETYGDYDWHSECYRHHQEDLAYTTFNRNAIAEINRRKQSRDFLLIPMGNFQRPISDAVEIPFTVEMGIGYTGVYTSYKVFESYAWMHHVYGLMEQGDGHYYDCVIPNYFEPSDFEYAADKEDYFLYLGRLIHRKGICIARTVVEEIGAKLILAGQKSSENVDIDSPNLTHIGFADFEKRKELLKKAKALFVPTIYIEPFGGVSIEAAFSGTPVITTDWGAFAENVIHGKTGFRCRTLDQFVWAARNIEQIKPQDCYEFAMSNFTVDRVRWMYEEFFNSILDINGQGWYALHPQRPNLDWLKRSY